MSLRTYGDKPMSFQLEETGEYYYVGSEVNFLNIIKGTPSHHINNGGQHRPYLHNRLETICGYSVDHCTKNTQD